MIITEEEKEKIYHCLCDIIDNSEFIVNNISNKICAKYIIKEVKIIANTLGISLD